MNLGLSFFTCVSSEQRELVYKNLFNFDVIYLVLSKFFDMARENVGHIAAKIVDSFVVCF
jgi:serine kinase of HPr protein (carbohydrate metabolism regulator)